jgi:GntR family transcriptional repressor for pyruvate dehydrogenase complex
VPDDPLVSEKVFAFFKEQFAAGHLNPGDRLLPERELAQRLGVSRPTLREVMRAMALLGVIEIRPGQKAVVTSPSADVLGDFFGMLLSMRPSIYEHILEARIAIECQAARLACANAQAADIERLGAALGRILETAEDDETGADADFAFHAQLVAASHNEVLRFIHEAIGALLRRSHHERRKAVRGEPDFLATLGEAHRQVIDAITTRNPDAAEAVVRGHFYIAQEHRARRGQLPGAPARNTQTRSR